MQYEKYLIVLYRACIQIQPGDRYSASLYQTDDSDLPFHRDTTMTLCIKEHLESFTNWSTTADISVKWSVL